MAVDKGVKQRERLILVRRISGSWQFSEWLSIPGRFNLPDVRQPIDPFG